MMPLNAEEARLACEELKANVLRGLSSENYDPKLLWSSWLNYQLLNLALEGKIVLCYKNGKLHVEACDEPTRLGASVGGVQE